MHDMYLAQIPKRTNQINKLGRNIIVETNMLKLIFAQNFQTNIIHYDVIITPDKPKFLLRTIFEEFRKKQCPKRYPAFDGKKNAYSAKILPFGDKSVSYMSIICFNHNIYSKFILFKFYFFSNTYIYIQNIDLFYNVLIIFIYCRRKKK